MTDDELVRLFWGKAGYDRTDLCSLHPAMFHMLDVGFAAQALVERNSLAALRGLWPEAPDLAARIGFLVALHDLGKISPGFQIKRDDRIAEARQAGFPFRSNSLGDHSRTTYLHLVYRAPELADILGSHHGMFQAAPCGSDGSLGGPKWEEARDAATAACGRVFGVDPACIDDPLQPDQVIALAGLTAVADWIGSDDRFFPRAGSEPPSLAEYAPLSLDQARAAVAKIGWDGWSPQGEPWDFGRLFPFEPNELQTAAIALAQDLLGPACVVIEAPMGMGKTEAALYLAEVLLHRVGHAGMYFALPTQATANPMFRRVWKDYLEKRLGTGEQANLHLLHGLAGFDAGYLELLDADKLSKPLPAPEPDEIHSEGTGSPRANRAEHRGVVAAEWFRGAKLGLISPFAVGTVDQALLGVLQVRHPFVRLWGLTNKVVVIDEVHAYDTYTGGVLERLVEWLANQGSSVILLSATLPAARRRALLRAYSGTDSNSDECAYPRLSVVQLGPPPVGEERTRAPVPVPPPIPLAAPPMKPATLQRLDVPEPWPQGPARFIADQLTDEGCAAWICNTVGRAQDAYLAICNEPSLADAEVILFHARFPVWRRKEIEARVLATLGKGVERPQKLVLIGTQTIEQSLDIDVDLMLTDIAPMDLLLQRMGRLHRHRDRDAGRPERLREARCWWIGPPSTPGPPSRPSGEREPTALPSFDDEAFVYTGWWVYRTWAMLQKPVVVETATRIDELVQQAYAGYDPDLPHLLTLAETLKLAAAAKEQNDRAWVESLTLYPPNDDNRFVMHSRHRDPDDEQSPAFQRAVTRLGDPTVTLICAEPTADPSLIRLADGSLIRTDRKPTRDEVSALILHSCRLASRQWVRHFLGMDRDGKEVNAGACPISLAWEEVPLLRSYRLVPFTGGVYQAEDGSNLRLDPYLGLDTRERSEGGDPAGDR